MFYVGVSVPLKVDDSKLYYRRAGVMVLSRVKKGDSVACLPLDGAFSTPLWREKLSYIQDGFLSRNNVFFRISLDGKTLSLVAKRDIPVHSELYLNWRAFSEIEDAEMRCSFAPVILEEMKDFERVYGNGPLNVPFYIDSKWERVTRSLAEGVIDERMVESAAFKIDEEFFGGRFLPKFTPRFEVLTNKEWQAMKDFPESGFMLGETEEEGGCGVVIRIFSDVFDSGGIASMVDGWYCTTKVELLVHAIAHEMVHVLQLGVMKSLYGVEYEEFAGGEVLGWHDGFFGSVAYNVFGHPMGCRPCAWESADKRFKKRKAVYMDNACKLSRV